MKLRVALYGRYSSDLQDELSIAGQFRSCRGYVERHHGKDWKVEHELADEEITGKSVAARPQYLRLVRLVEQGKVDIVLAESMSRLTRGQAETARLYEVCKLKGARIFTTQHGEITRMHVAMSGYQSAQYLEDLALQTRRGLIEKVKAGQSGGGKSYGYDSANAVQTINEQQAAVVRRIFDDYVRGVSPQQIAKQLNDAKVAGPGASWGPTTIHGQRKNGTGILNNELYVGRRIFNRREWRTDPDNLTSGGKVKRVPIINPESEWVIEDVPHLRIISDEVWKAAKARQDKMTIASVGGSAAALTRTHRAHYVFSGLVKCGVCGHSYTNINNRLRCSGRYERGVCDNALTLLREDVEQRVLDALEKRFEDREQHEALALFCEEWRKHVNEQYGTQRGMFAAAKRELAEVTKKKDKLLDLLTDGVLALDPDTKQRFADLAARKIALAEMVERAEKNPPPPSLHPDMSKVYAAKIATLRDALRGTGAEVQEAHEALRALVEVITVNPDSAEPGKIVVQGTLASMLKHGEPDVDWEGYATLVAGARNGRDVLRWIA